MASVSHQLSFAGYVLEASLRPGDDEIAMLTSPLLLRNVGLCLKFYYNVSSLREDSDFVVIKTGQNGARFVCDFY